MTKDGNDIHKVLDRHRLVLTEAAIIESLRRGHDIPLHPRLENALLIYDGAGQTALGRLYQEYIAVASGGGLPIALCTPTWRAGRDRLSEAGVAGDVNGDAVGFLKRLRKGRQSGSTPVLVGGLVGCRNDCYQPREGLAVEEAKAFHSWQIDRLAEAGPDFLLAATLPAVPEATGIAQAMAATGIPYIISFVIGRQGRILDGNRLERAFGDIDAACPRPPLGYMINCAYPSFLLADHQPASVFDRLVGFQGNASSLDHAELDGCADRQADEISDWGDRMLALHRRYGVRILGGCCGTGAEHLQYLVDHVHRHRGAEAGPER